MNAPDTPELRKTMAALLKAMPGLTLMELNVCLLILEQKATRKIADRLGISERTVQNHRYSIRKKLGREGSLMVELMRVRGD